MRWQANNVLPVYARSNRLFGRREFGTKDDLEAIDKSTESRQVV